MTIQEVAAKFLPTNFIGNTPGEKLLTAMRVANLCLLSHGIDPAKLTDAEAKDAINFANNWYDSNKMDLTKTLQNVVTGDEPIGNLAFKMPRNKVSNLLAAAWRLAAVGVPAYASGVYLQQIQAGTQTKDFFDQDYTTRMNVFAAIVRLQELHILDRIDETPANSPGFESNPLAAGEVIIVLGAVAIAALMWITIILGIVGLVGTFTTFTIICLNAQSKGDKETTNVCVQAIADKLKQPANPGGDAITTLAWIGGLGAVLYFVGPKVMEYVEKNKKK